jgi:hypothetical protein
MMIMLLKHLGINYLVENIKILILRFHLFYLIKISFKTKIKIVTIKMKNIKI